MTRRPIFSESSVVRRALRRVNCHRTTEAYFIGYPKTGNTWLRFMLGKYVQLACGLSNHPLFDETDGLGRCMKYCVGPSIQFTHRPLVWRAQSAAELRYDNVVRPFESKKIVLLVRHPLDVAVSHWLQVKYRANEKFDAPLLAFLADANLGLDKFIKFYSLWYNHQTAVRQFHLIRYEDLRADPEVTFSKLLDFLDIDQNRERISKIVAAASFDSMKKLEQGRDSLTYESGQSIFATGDRTNPEAFHVRRGKIGGFNDYLQIEDICRLKGQINRRLPAVFGYSSVA